LDNNYEELVKTYSNTRIEIRQCGYLKFIGESLDWQGKFQAVSRSFQNRNLL